MLLLIASFPTRATALIAMVKTCRLVITLIKYPKLVLLFDFFRFVLLFKFTCLGKIESLRSKIFGRKENLGQSSGVQNFSLVTLKT